MVGGELVVLIVRCYIHLHAGADTEVVISQGHRV